MYQEKQCAIDLMSASCCGDIYQTYIRAKQNEVQQDLYTPAHVYFLTKEICGTKLLST